MRSPSSIIFAGMLLAGCATMTTAQEDATSVSSTLDNDLDGLGRNLLVRAEADSWQHLVEKVKPDFTWGGDDLMWIDADANGKLIAVTLDEAYVLKEPGKPARWVLLETVDDDHFEFDSYYGEVMGRNLRGVAKPQNQPPTPESDAELYGEYAYIRGANPKAGIVYEVGWQRLMANGTCLCESSRRIYLFEDLAHRWHFLGEGPEVGHGKSGASQGEWQEVPSVKVEWTNDRSATPLKIHFTIESTESEWDDGQAGNFVPRPDFVTYDEYTLSSSPPSSPPEGEGAPYLIAKPDDTFDKIVNLIAKWRPDNDGGASAVAFWRSELARLNPNLSPGDIPAGTHIRILTYADFIKAYSSFQN